MLSAHHDAERVEVTSGARPTTIHDFGGFPRELYELLYAAPGAPELAARILDLLVSADIDAALEPTRGFDHGAWIPMLLMYPAADLPLVQVSIDSARDAAWHLALGRALRPLRDEGVLVIGSGGATHNLGLYMHAGRAATTRRRPSGWRNSMTGSPRRSTVGATTICCTIASARPTPRRIIRPRSTFCRCSRR